MKKCLVIFVLLASAFSGCSFLGQQKSETPAKPKAEQSKPKAEKKDYYIGLNAPVEGIKDWVYRYQRYEGVFLQKMGDYRAVLVTMGEKFSPGYKVTIDKVTKREDKWIVEASFKQPKEEDYSGKSVSPSEVISIKDDGRPVEVLQVTGKNALVPLKVIEIPEGRRLAVSKSFIAFTPPEGEKITSPVRITGKARVFEAAFRIDLTAGSNTLARKHVMADQGAPGWGYFEVSLPFTRPAGQEGTIVLSYANMATGELIKELLLPVKF